MPCISSRVEDISSRYPVSHRIRNLMAPLIIEVDSFSRGVKCVVRVKNDLRDRYLGMCGDSAFGKVPFPRCSQRILIIFLRFSPPPYS
jgi:hypothetical protein